MTDVADSGRFAFFDDPSGATFGVWEPGASTGAALVNEPNSSCWNEVLTRDKDAVLAFSPGVFDWTAETPNFEPSGGYTVWKRGDGSHVGGALAMTDAWFSPETPAHWAVTFAVADTDAIVAAARELGAEVTTEPMDTPIGRFAGFVDPQGVGFSVMGRERETGLGVRRPGAA